MTVGEAKSAVSLFLVCCKEINEVAKTATKHGKSLSGDNFYGNKFSNLIVTLAKAEINIIKLIQQCDLEEAEATKIVASMSSLKSPHSTSLCRVKSLKHIRLVCETVLLPGVEMSTSNPIPETEQVLPLSVVQPAGRTYLDRVILQANGSYERQWFDACSVMVRRFIETLIIEAYEANAKQSLIQDSSGNYRMLKDLIDIMLADNTWNLGRETKQALPLVKSLGDRSAHNRRYVATKQDVDKVIPGLRVVADDLLHLAKLK